MNKNFRVNALIVIYFAGFISCLNTGKTGQQPIEKEILTQADIGYLEMDGDSILIPDFDIEVSLSPNAEKKLKEDQETVIVSAMFYGTPKDTLSDEYQFMGVSVKNYNIELTTQRVARFEKIRFHSSILNKLADTDIFLLINVFSGRRSSENNILDVEILEDKMSVIKGKKYILRGKLIGEGD